MSGKPRLETQSDCNFLMFVFHALYNIISDNAGRKELFNTRLLCLSLSCLSLFADMTTLPFRLEKLILSITIMVMHGNELVINVEKKYSRVFLGISVIIIITPFTPSNRLLRLFHDSVKIFIIYSD